MLCLAHYQADEKDWPADMITSSFGVFSSSMITDVLSILNEIIRKMLISKIIQETLMLHIVNFINYVPCPGVFVAINEIHIILVVTSVFSVLLAHRVNTTGNNRCSRVVGI